jgi:outer membrane protein OmpA-like peptidoglycan-associated protein
MLSKLLTAKTLGGLYLMSPLLLILPGCLATRGWVSEQIKPVGTRMTNIEEKMALTDPQLAANLVSQQVQPLKTRVTGVEQRVSGMEDRLASTESATSQVNSKADKILTEFKDLRLERRLVLDLKRGAYFEPNSADLLTPAKKNIDKLLSSLERQPSGNHFFFVAGYTDSMGSSDLNYKLGRKRADSVGRYLIVKKAIHPMRVVTVSGGDGNPVANNSTPQGREKNRRVEILVYKNVISGVQADIAATLSRMSLTPEISPPGR